LGVCRAGIAFGQDGRKREGLRWKAGEKIDVAGMARSRTEGEGGCRNFREGRRIAAVMRGRVKWRFDSTFLRRRIGFDQPRDDWEIDGPRCHRSATSDGVRNRCRALDGDQQVAVRCGIEALLVQHGMRSFSKRSVAAFVDPDLNRGRSKDNRV